MNSKDKNMTVEAKKNMIFIVCVLIISFAIIKIFNVFYGVARVSGNSMYPTLKNRQFLIYSTDVSNIDYGDIIVFKNEKTDNSLYIKRVFAKAGDSVKVIGTTYIRNGVEIDEPYTNKYSNPYTIDKTISKGCVYVLGDNRDNSIDSREFDEINIKTDVIGIIK